MLDRYHGRGQKKCDAVMVKFDAFLPGPTKRNFRTDEAIHHRLYTLIETCDYATLKDEIIRDRIVVGILEGIPNTALSERMQSEANLTLEKAKTMAPQKEAIAEQSAQLRDGIKQSPILLGQVRGNPSSKPQSRRRDTAVRSDKRSTVKDAAPGFVGKPHCTRCGKSEHQKRDRCKRCNMPQM